MKTENLNTIQATLALMLAAAQPLAPSSAHAGADRAGNGGDFDEMEFTGLAYEVVDSLEILQGKHELRQSIDVAGLKSRLRKLQVRFVRQPQAGEQVRSAVNFPAENAIEVDRAEWQQRRTKITKLDLVTHELLPLVGVDDKSYKVSAPLMKQFEAEKLIRDAKQVKVEPVLLDSLDAPGARAGYTFDEVREFCERTRSLNRSEYFFVYCTYTDKFWDEVEWMPVADTDSSFTAEFGRRLKLSGTERIQYHSIPVSVEENVYTVNVYGLGLLRELPFQVVAGSAGLAGGLIDRTFASRTEAMDACRERLISENKNVLFLRSTCRAIQNETTGEYLYEVVTQNPLYLKK